VWVLWSEAILPRRGWAVVTTYPTMRDCEAVLAALAQEFARKQDERWEVFRRGTQTVLAYNETPPGAVRYRCLPDTVDPRAPKGK
jgi:hypothetical protein